MLVVSALNIGVTALVVLVHFQSLYLLSRFIPHLGLPHHFRIVVGVGGALLAHLAEIWLFGLVYYWMNERPDWGSLVGNFNGELLDCVYFSMTTYTTVGYGDIEPFGPIRYVSGIEALTGLVMITWSASFLFLEMQRTWKLGR
ncbi:MULTISPECIES: potassium channel family protein [Marinobacter]|uniref:potassium channel family protein n=1 Tax=Marinobacter TaxID=2742 RepID=UPI000DAE0655|nr:MULTISPECIES: potassium channel family protein [Marinobacter]